jgi:HK97 gp10 family phage protein
MAVTTRIKLNGATELKAALEELGTVVATKVGVKANRNAARKLAALLAGAAPYDPSTRKKYWKRKDGSVGTANYGHLRDNIRVRKIKSMNANTVRHLVSTGDAFWGNFLEFGTAKMAAQPWARPVLDRHYGEISEEQISGLREGIARELARIARTKARNKR